MHLHKDIAFISLKLIKFAEMFDVKSLGRSKYFINLYFSYDKKQPKTSGAGILGQILLILLSSKNL